MGKYLIIGLSLLVLTAGAATALPAQEPNEEGFAERLGEKLDRGIRKLGNEIREEWSQIQSSIEKMGVHGRVYSRLRWDRHVDVRTIELKVQENDIVVLEGYVADSNARKKAVELTRDTVGVRDVVDRLMIQPVESVEKVER